MTNALLMVIGVAVVVVGAYFSRDYVRRVLLWVAGQEAWVVVLVFLALFTFVSMVSERGREVDEGAEVEVRKENKEEEEEENEKKGGRGGRDYMEREEEDRDGG